MTDKAYQLGVNLAIGDPVDTRYANLPADTCRVYFASHGCYLPRGHPGDQLSHVCDPCPPDCPDAYQDEDWNSDPGWNDHQHCKTHCNMRPWREHLDKLYGEDVGLYPYPQPGMPS